MESHLVRIINRPEAMTKDGGNLKRNFEREGVVVAEVAYSHDEENGSLFTLRDVEARETYTFDSIDLIAMEIYELFTNIKTTGSKGLINENPFVTANGIFLPSSCLILHKSFFKTTTSQSFTCFTP